MSPNWVLPGNVSLYLRCGYTFLLQIWLHMTDYSQCLLWHLPGRDPMPLMHIRHGDELGWSMLQLLWTGIQIVTNRCVVVAVTNSIRTLHNMIDWSGNSLLLFRWCCCWSSEDDTRLFSPQQTIGWEHQLLSVSWSSLNSIHCLVQQLMEMILTQSCNIKNDPHRLYQQQDYSLLVNWHGGKTTFLL